MSFYQKFQFKILLTFTFLLFPLLAFGQNPVSWSLESDAKGKTLKAEEKFKAKLKAKIEGEWHLYAVEQPDGGPFPTKITVAENLPFQLDGKTESPTPITKFDKNFNIDTKFFAKEAEFNLPLKATAEAKGDDLAINVKYQVCDDTTCLPPKTVKVTFAGFEDVKKSASSTTAPISTETKQENQIQNPKSEIQNPNDLPLGSFIWLAITLGALSLLTPCVFPMIPITVSYFTNHSSKTRGNAIKLATIYSLGIIATFTLLGMLLAIFVGAAGINLFAANPWVNIIISVIFLFFAFNLFGAYEITVPTGILTK
nr:protein-disulfide reductase DsbD family protein [Pyrinomonadaceae bacterium]